MAEERVFRGSHGTVHISSGDSRGPYRTYDQWRTHVENTPAIDARYGEFLANLARDPLQPTEIVLAARRREEENKRRGGRTGYDW